MTHLIIKCTIILCGVVDDRTCKESHLVTQITHLLSLRIKNSCIEFMLSMMWMLQMLYGRIRVAKVFVLNEFQLRIKLIPLVVEKEDYTSQNYKPYTYCGARGHCESLYPIKLQHFRHGSYFHHKQVDVKSKQADDFLLQVHTIICISY